jgi:hypothetical protein
MQATEYLFCEWTDLVGEGDRARITVRETIKIGEDSLRNFLGLSRVELFSSCFRPVSMGIQGEKLIGLMAETHHGEYFFYALYENIVPGEVKEIKVWLEGAYTVPHFFSEGREKYVYESNFAWIGPHFQRISFPKGYEILSVKPGGGEVRSYRGRPTVVWCRPGEFWGEIEVRLRRRG